MEASSIIATVRTQSGMTARELASRAGTSASTLSAYERGHVVPSVATLDRIVRAAGFIATVELMKAPSASDGASTIEELLLFVDGAPSWRDQQLDAPIWPREARLANVH